MHAAIAICLSAIIAAAAGQGCYDLYQNRSTCLADPTAHCAWCANATPYVCAPASYGSCCPINTATACCNQGGYPGCFAPSWCPPGTQCVRKSTPSHDAARTGPLCELNFCCPTGQTDVCWNDAAGNSQCFDPTVSQCCWQTGNPAPKDNTCCNSYGGNASCAPGYSCCGGSPICCHTATEVCVDDVQNTPRCVKRHPDTACRAYLSAAACAAVVSNTTGVALCEYCAGECHPKTAGRCCEPPNGEVCYGQSASDWGPCKAPSQCLNATLPYGAPDGNPCQWTNCCPADKPAVCGGAGCYDPQTEQCCEGRGKDVGPKSDVCCPLGLCPEGTTCCGHETNKVCCTAGQVCYDGSGTNYCR